MQKYKLCYLIRFFPPTELQPELQKPCTPQDNGALDRRSVHGGGGAAGTGGVVRVRGAGAGGPGADARAGPAGAVPAHRALGGLLQPLRVPLRGRDAQPLRHHARALGATC